MKIPHPGLSPEAVKYQVQSTQLPSSLPRVGVALQQAATKN